MIDDVFDSVVSGLSKSGFITWEVTSILESGRYYKSPLTFVDYENIKLPKKTKIKVFNCDRAYHTPIITQYILKDLL